MTTAIRWLMQKMEFFSEGATAEALPDDATLRLMAAHPERFARVPQVTFEQVLVEGDTATALTALNGGRPRRRSGAGRCCRRRWRGWRKARSMGRWQGLLCRGGGAEAGGVAGAGGIGLRAASRAAERVGTGGDTGVRGCASGGRGRLAAADGGRSARGRVPGAQGPLQGDPARGDRCGKVKVVSALLGILLLMAGPAAPHAPMAPFTLKGSFSLTGLVRGCGKVSRLLGEEWAGGGGPMVGAPTTEPDVGSNPGVSWRRAVGLSDGSSDAGGLECVTY